MRNSVAPLLLPLLFTAVSAAASQSVTVYVSEDQVFSEPVLNAFEKETGITVNALYDTEESKSTGVMNRLLAERRNPHADVYWANEPIRAEVLKARGVLAPYDSPAARGIDPVFKDPQHYWNGFSARLRVLIVNNRAKTVPHSVFDYADPRFKGRAVIANPLFGTTTSHIAALFTVLGDTKAEAFLDALKANGTAISTGNGESADFVAEGLYDFSLVDSDDAISRLRRGHPVHIVYPDQGENAPGVFVVPNTVMLIKGAPHPQAAKKLIDYLLDPKTEARLAAADCAQIPLHQGVKMPPELRPVRELKVMRVDYAKIAKKLIGIQPRLKRWLPR